MPNKKMSPGEIKARIGSSIVARRAAVAGAAGVAGKMKTSKRKGIIPLVGASAGLTAGLLTKAFKKAKENKPSGRINLDDVSRAVKAMKKKK